MSRNLPIQSGIGLLLLLLALGAAVSVVPRFEVRRSGTGPTSPLTTLKFAQTSVPREPVFTRLTTPPPSIARSSSAAASSGPPSGAGHSGTENARATRVDAYRRWLTMTAGLRAAGSGAPAWKPMGPQSESNVNIGGSVRYICSGRVTAIALVPNSQSVLIGTAGGGVWRLDPGSNPSWIPLTDAQPTLSIGALAVDPSNPNTIYAGTGEQNNSADEYLGVGVLKSTDGGANWTLLGSSDFTNIGAIAVDPFDSSVVIVGTHIGVQRSTNGGVNWQRVLPSAAADTTADSVVFDPSNKGVVYASMGGTTASTQAGVYMSVDSGATWSAITGSGSTALPVGNAGRITLTLGPPSSPGLFAGVSQYMNSTPSTPADPIDEQPFIGLYQLGQGNSWQLLASGANAYCAPSGTRSQCDYNNVMAIQPTSNGKPGIMLGGGINLRMSTDGVHWSDVTAPNSTNPAVHSDQHAIVFSPDGSTVYVGDDGGVWSGSISGSTITWTDLNATLTLAQFYPGLSVHPTNINISFGGTQDNNVLAFNGQAQWSSVTGDDGAATAIDPVNPANVYASVAATDITMPIYKSTDGGKTFNTSDSACPPPQGYSTNIDSNSLPFPNFLTIDPNFPSTLYFTGKSQVYQSTSSACSWTSISGDLTLNPNVPNLDPADQLCHVAVAPTDSTTVYAASCYGAVSVTHQAGNGQSLKTGLPWAPISAGLPRNMLSYRMTHVIPDPSLPGRLFVTTSQPGAGRVFVTANDGHTWTDLTNNLPNVEVTHLVVDPDIPSTLYVATTMGVYWSTNGGQVWSVLGSGLPNSPVTSLILHASRMLRAATHGRGVWDLPIPADANLVPVIGKVSPPQIDLNTAPTLTITGQNFTTGSQILCDGSALQTTYVSAAELTAPAAACGTATDSLLDVAVFTPAPGGGQSNDMFIKVGPAPAINPAGIVDGASFSGYALAPGEIVSIFGSNLSSAPAFAPSSPLPPTLNGTAATLTDSTTSKPEPLANFYVSPNQLNFQVPWDVPISGNATFVVSNGGVASAPVAKPLAKFAPGIFVLSNGSPAITFNDSLNLPQTPSSATAGFTAMPAKAGDYLNIYCTGLGAVSNQPAYGGISPGLPNLATTTSTPTVLIQGQPAKVTYSGLAPGFVGLYQINVMVPSGLIPGSSLSLLITDGVDVRSNTVFIAVQ